jgi:hypothetical protein
LGSRRSRPFSTTWVVVSLVVFFVVELILGGLLHELVVKRYLSQMLHLRLQVVLSLVSYAIGGFIVGVISPGKRILEPAVGAALSVVLTLIISWFLPWRFAGFGWNKLLLGAGLAFVIGLASARAGEQLMGNVRRDELI